MSLKVLTIEEFNDKIKQFIPFHEVSILQINYYNL